MGERLFYVSVGGAPGKGPVPLDDVRTRIAGGSLPADALICEVGSTEWRTVASLDSRDAPAPSGPLPPPPPPLPPARIPSPSQPRRSGRTVALIAGVVAVLAITAGVVAFVRMRASTPKLCPGTPKLLASLHSPLVVEAYVTRGLPKLDTFVQQLQKLLAQYQANGGGHFSFSIIEANDEESKRMAKNAGLVEQPFGEASGTEQETASIAKGFMGLVLKYGGQQDAIKFLPPDRTEGLEFWIDNKIRELRAKADNRQYHLGVLTGRGEIAVDEENLVASNMGKFSMKGIITQNFPFYVLSAVDLRGDAEMDPGVQGLLVTQPESDLSDAELARIDAFVLQGKPVAFFVGAANVRRGDATMRAALSTHGLERLLGGYGIELGRDVVVDLGPKASPSIAVATATGNANVQLPFVPLVGDEDHRLDASFPAFFRLEQVAFPLASSLVLHRDRQPEATLRELARSSPRAVRVVGDSVDLHPLKKWSPEGAEGPVVLAVAEEGTIHGAFDPGRKSTGRARILVVASSQFLANPLARAGNAAGSGPTLPLVPGDEQLLQVAGPYAQQQITSSILVFKNTLDWLSFEDDLVDCSLVVGSAR
jgi:ABC-type uncharacterized transport system involved in gliding motility auxiliary subunit